LAIFAISLAAAVNASAQAVFSGDGLNSLVYSANIATDAQYIAASDPTPALAALYTDDSGTSESADSPAVFAEGPWGTLNAFSASYDLYSSLGQGSNAYWILYLSDDPDFASPIVADGGPTLNASSLVHVGDLINGSITLSALDTNIDPVSDLPYGQDTVAWAGIEIGEWNNGTNVIPAAASFDSIAIVPEPGTVTLVGMSLVGMLLAVRRRKA
jgi:hypothetical protein